jgi:polyisoprenoid-binding protein YceI
MARKQLKGNSMKKIAVAVIAAAGMVYGACTVEPGGSLNVGWEAYKTAAKVGVKGGFGSVSIEGMEASASVKELLKGSRMTIKTATVDSKNPGRDATLVQFFFEKMAGRTISGKVLSVEGDDLKGVVTVEITMNGVTRAVPMQYSANKGEVQAYGYIDLADFSALPALAAINKACYDLHQGKTWQDVAISFQLPLKTRCR